MFASDLRQVRHITSDILNGHGTSQTHLQHIHHRPGISAALEWAASVPPDQMISKSQTIIPGGKLPFGICYQIRLLTALVKYLFHCNPHVTSALIQNSRRHGNWLSSISTPLVVTLPRPDNAEFLLSKSDCFVRYMISSHSHTHNNFFALQPMRSCDFEPLVTCL